MIDQLSVFTSEVTRVAREVGTSDKLGGQAQVPGVAGTRKDLTDNVNSMASNLPSLTVPESPGETLTDQPSPADPAAAATALPAANSGPQLRQRAEAAFREQVAQLPADLVAALREATCRADYQQMLALTEPAATHDERLGRRLRQLVKRFDYNTLHELLAAHTPQLMKSDSNLPAHNLSIVDDSPAKLELLIGMLPDRGLRVGPVAGGERALPSAQSDFRHLISHEIRSQRRCRVRRRAWLGGPSQQARSLSEPEEALDWRVGWESNFLPVAVQGRRISYGLPSARRKVGSGD